MIHNTILLTDTHFGIRQNSITWLDSQKDFFKLQVIPFIQGLQEPPTLIHMGDVFDSRSSISTLIGTEVVNMFKDIRKIVNKFIIISGNHDFYSPNSNSINTLNLLLSPYGKDFEVISSGIKVDGESLYIAWESWKDPTVRDVIARYHIKDVFTHADIFGDPSFEIPEVRIWSGHIHTPRIEGNKYNIGSCYALNFGDAGGRRGFYYIDNDKIDFIENTSSIKFWRLYNEDIFQDMTLDKKDYIEIYISKDNFTKEEYIKKTEEFVNNFKRVQIVPYEEKIDQDRTLIKAGKYDIKSITESMIPEHLKDKFQKILERIEEKSL